ncbi:MAG: GGDEF domain-containing protein, partial [Deltaproteobacteria bacterium]|nr:GGDEF domain-containing protein [Deltaproteobacteria bacterium]
LDGNKVLKTISRLIQKNSRGTDTTCRFGGEEFCIVMPEVEKEGAIAIAKRLIKSIESDKSHHRKVTMSGGVSSYPKDGKTHMELIKAADKRLYKAKAAGRNKIVCS